MTNFNPEGDFKDIETWEAIAENKAGQNGITARIIGGVLVGGLGVTMGVELLGGVIAAWLVKSAWDALLGAGKRLRVVRDMGCNAFVLDEDNFRTYVRQFGPDTVIAELAHALDAGCGLTPFAQNWLDCQTKSLTPTQEVAAINAGNHKDAVINASSYKDTVTNPGSHKDTVTNPGNYTPLEAPTTPLPMKTVVDTYNPIEGAQIDIIGEMSARITTSLIVGVSGSGKGVLVSNAIRAALRQHPGLKVFVIDPKADPKEAGYWHLVADRIVSHSCMDAKPSTVAEWAEYAFNQYAEYANHNERTLLIVDEGTLLGNKLASAKSTLLKDKITAYTSAGDSAGRNVWLMLQSPYIGSASLDLSASSQMTTIVIAWQENIGALAQWKSAKIFQQLSLDVVTELIEQSPRGRAIYYGKTGRWYMMEELENYSGYDRDSRKYLPGIISKIDNKIGEGLSGINSQNHEHLPGISPQIDNKNREGLPGINSQIDNKIGEDLPGITPKNNNNNRRDLPGINQLGNNWNFSVGGTTDSEYQPSNIAPENQAIKDLSSTAKFILNWLKINRKGQWVKYKGSDRDQAFLNLLSKHGFGSQEKMVNELFTELFVTEKIDINEGEGAIIAL